MPEFAVPEFAVPELTYCRNLPSAGICRAGTFLLPQLSVPQKVSRNFLLPQLTVPEFTVPQFAVPQFT